MHSTVQVLTEHLGNQFRDFCSLYGPVYTSLLWTFTQWYILLQVRNFTVNIQAHDATTIWLYYGHNFVDSRFWRTVYNSKNQCDNCKQHESFSWNTTHWSQSLRCAQVINCKGYVVSRQDTNRNNPNCMLSVRHHYNTTRVTPCSTEHFLKCFLTFALRANCLSHKPQENCLYPKCTEWCSLNSPAVQKRFGHSLQTYGFTASCRW